MTIRQSFGQRTNPNWDALRVQTLSVLGGIAVDSGADAGLLNRIYVWHADTSTLGVYFPDESGIDDALAAAVSGDTIWLPSVPIAITAAKVLPASVAMAGLSPNSILSFSGFNGTALTLSVDSALWNFSLNFISNGATAIGINAQAQGARVIHTRVEVSGGSSSNVGIVGGFTSALVAKELYTLVDQDHLILWYDIAAVTWYSIAHPTNYTVPDHSNDTFSHGIQVSEDGSALYICGKDTGNSNRPTIWQLDNFAAIRAAPATAPSWSVILYNGQALGGGFGTLACDTYTAWFMRCISGHLYARLKNTTSPNPDAIFADYDGAAWTFTFLSPTNLDAAQTTAAVRDDSYFDCHLTGGSNYLRQIDNTQIGSSWLQDSGLSYTSEIWKRLDSSALHYVSRRKSSHTYIHTPEGNSDVVDVASSAGNLPTIRGALIGPHIYSVFNDGNLHSSDDGSSFSILANWAHGWVMDHAYAGGGLLYWLKSNGNKNTTIIRRYTRAGSVDADLTGNLWSLCAGAAVARKFMNLAIVYDTTADPVGDAVWVIDNQIRATGTGAIGLKVAATVYGLQTILTATTGLQVDAAGILYADDCTYETATITGTLEPLAGDRAVFDALNYAARHTNDTDISTGIHHTLGGLVVNENLILAAQIFGG